jgi:hypothetical protein
MLNLKTLEIPTNKEFKSIVIDGKIRPRHRTLLKSYLLNLNLGFDVVKDLIELDIRSSIDIGANTLTEDLLIILELYENYCKKNDISEFK